MLSRLKDFAESLTPNIIQYPFKRIKKAYDNLVTYQRKILVSSIRLISELSVALLAMSTLWMSPDFKHLLFGLAFSELENPLAAAIVGYSVLFLAGFGLGSFISKQCLRLYHQFKFGVTNSDYIGLSDREKTSLEEKWSIISEISNAIFNFLVKKIFQAKKKALQDNKITSSHEQTIVSTKLALQTFRRSAKDPNQDLIPLVEYFEQELARSKTHIRATRMQISHLSKPLQDIRVDNLSNEMELPSTEWQEDDIESMPEYHPEVTDKNKMTKLPLPDKKPVSRTASFWYKKPSKLNNMMIRRLETSIQEHEENIRNIRHFMLNLQG